MKNDIGVYIIFKYYFYYTPFMLYYSAPLIFALANLIALGFMSVRNEIIVMRSSGIGIFRISSPILILSLVFGLFMFFADESVVGRSLDKAYYIKVVKFGSKTISNLWSKKGDMFINIEKLNTKTDEGKNVKIYRVNGTLKQVIYAKDVLLKNNKIVLKNVEIVDMDSKYTKKNYKEKELNIALKDSDFLHSPQKSGYSLKELVHYLQNAKDRDYYMSILLFKLFYPLSPFILTLLSLVFVLKITPRKDDFIKNIFFGGISFIIFTGSFAFIVSMSKMSIVNPLFSVLIFMLFWLSISVYNLLKLGV